MSLFVHINKQFIRDKGFNVLVVYKYDLQMAMSEAMSRRIRAILNTFNFWSIVLYNVLALNSLDFAKLVAKRLLLKGDFGC